jgi:hypothetical protein
MRRPAVARRREGELTRLRLGERNHIRHRLRRHGGVHRHDQRQLRQQDDRQEVLCRIVRQAGVEMRADAVRGDRVQQQRVAVRIRLGDGGRRDRAAGTAPIADDDRLPQCVGELRPDRAGDEIRRPSGRNRHHQLHRAGRVAALGGNGSGNQEGDGGKEETEAFDAHAPMLGGRKNPGQ